MKIELTKADLLKGSPIEPGWYGAEIVNYFPKPSKDGGSLNHIFTLKLPKKDGTEIEHNFNSKAIGMMAPFIAAIQEKPIKEIIDAMGNNTLAFDTDTVIGMKIQVKIKNEQFEGRLLNKVDGFLPYSAQIPL